MGMKDRLDQIKQRAQDAGRTVVDVGVETAREKRDAATGLARGKVDAATGFAGELKTSISEGDVEELLKRLPLPADPVVEPWQWSLSKLVTAGSKPPTGTGVLLRQLDRFGTIDIGPEEVGFDGDTAKWGKVQAIRTRTLDGIVEKLSTDNFIDRISTVLPPVPGRSWAAEKATEAVFTLWALVSELAIKDPEAGSRQVVCEIEYKGWIRTREAETGFFTGPVMALLPGLDQIIRGEAGRRGVQVEAAPSTSTASAEQRAAWLREKHAAIVAKRERLQEKVEN
ncbi:hypothetical protein L0U85_00680 [Glycomyces sp. L485]|uniref:hypothetical protein n=1 Tax=Glycomyces sp. L485 TaxID=2909235 RepID=UPI001F4A5132|nr:hypothetical protein [Glycomyces sp. L485]MCH7229384.1 hypothetical protein [Glycomyces sp. L485]